MASEFINTPSYVARGTINVGRFVRVDATYDKGALQANAASRPVGVTGPGQHDPPGLTGTADGVIARLGQSFKFFGPGCADILLEAGAGGWTRGDYLMPDADGKGILGTTGNWVGAQALTSVAANGMGTVRVIEATRVP